MRLKKPDYFTLAIKTPLLSEFGALCYFKDFLKYMQGKYCYIYHLVKSAGSISRGKLMIG